MRGDGPDWLDPDEGYSFLVLAAHEARRESRRYWAGMASLKYPLLPLPWWPDVPDPDEIAARQPRTRRGISENGGRGL
jgi:hypothetical protein